MNWEDTRYAEVDVAHERSVSIPSMLLCISVVVTIILAICTTSCDVKTYSDLFGNCKKIVIPILVFVAIDIILAVIIIRIKRCNDSLREMRAAPLMSV